MRSSICLAHVLSLLLSPYTYSVLVSLIYWVEIGYIGGFFQLLIMLIFLSSLPLFLVYAGHIRGDVDIYISKREKRTRYYVGVLTSYTGGMMLHMLLEYPEYVPLYSAYIAVGVVLLIINLRWKISVHTAGVSGPNLVLQFISNKPYILLTLTLVPVIWARYKLKAHTMAQLVAGAFISLMITYLVTIVLRALGLMPKVI